MSDTPPPPPPPPPPTNSRITSGRKRRTSTGAVIILVAGLVAIQLSSMIGIGPYEGDYPEELYIQYLWNFFQVIAWFLLIVGLILIAVGVILLIRRIGSNGGGLSSDTFSDALPGTGLQVLQPQDIMSAQPVVDDSPVPRRRRQAAGIIQIVQGGLIYVAGYGTFHVPLLFPSYGTWSPGVLLVACFASVTGYRCFLGKSWGRNSVCWLQLLFFISVPVDASYAFQDLVFSYILFGTTFVLAFRGREDQGARS